MVEKLTLVFVNLLRLYAALDNVQLDKLEALKQGVAFTNENNEVYNDLMDNFVKMEVI